MIKTEIETSANIVRIKCDLCGPSQIAAFNKCFPSGDSTMLTQHLLQLHPEIFPNNTTLNMFSSMNGEQIAFMINGGDVVHYSIR